jgi:hypothetical protein
MRKKTLLTALLLSLLAGVTWAGSTVGSRIWREQSLESRSYRKYYVEFQEGEEARAGAIAQYDNSDIDMEIYDEGGCPVTSDRLTDARPVCIWTPDSTQVYTIKIINCERYDLKFHMVTN